VKATMKQRKITFKQFCQFPLVTTERKLGSLSETLLWKEQPRYLQRWF